MNKNKIILIIPLIIGLFNLSIFIKPIESDPALVASTEIGLRVNYHYLHYVEGYWHAFYSASNILYHKSSSDGNTWSSATQVTDLYTNSRFNTKLISTATADYIHAIFVHPNPPSGTAYQTLYLKVGDPQADGTIVWETMQLVQDFNINLALMDKVKDTSANHWYAVVGISTDVIKVKHPDGTVTTLKDYPDGANPAIVLLALTSAKVFVIYGRNGALLAGRLWDGSTWQAEETLISTTLANNQFRCKYQRHNLCRGSHYSRS